jgi:16S rRNA (uracil1498-N3)-methyltransferase
MLRVYNEVWEGGFDLPPLSSEESHHLMRVRRARMGEGIEVLNGRGHLGRGRVAGLEGATIDIELDAVQKVDPPRPAVTLLVGMPKGKVFPSLLHRAVELGASEIIPLVTEHSDVSMERGQAKVDRWQAVLVEALKQSGNPHLPRLHEPTTLQEAVSHTEGASRVVLALVPDAVPLQTFVAKTRAEASRIALFVGPEGDFSAAEYAYFRTVECQLASMGPLVLKVETAALVALSLFKFCPSPVAW